MKIWHISDTHCFHHGLKIPDTDIVIHSGDATNTIDVAFNTNEMLDFLEWFAKLPFKRKIFVPGNHDVSLWVGSVTIEQFADHGIDVLINSEVEIDGFKIWGSPYTPRLFDHYTNWAWGLKRSDMDKVWSLIPDDTDILVTHGPPKGILDLCRDHENKDAPVQAGDKILLNKANEIKPRAHLFGHIHDEKSYINFGTFFRNEVLFSNGACAARTKMHLANHGNIFEA